MWLEQEMELQCLCVSAFELQACFTPARLSSSCERSRHTWGQPP